MRKVIRPKATEHLSLRKFFMTTSIMITILFLFQSTQVIREYVSKYEENDYVPRNPVTFDATWPSVEIDVIRQEFPETASNVIQPDQTSPVDYAHGRIVYVGAGDSAEAGVVRQWCALTKRMLGMTDAFPPLDRMLGAEAVLVSGDRVTGETEVDALIELAENGVPVVLCSLPDVALIEESPSLRRIMGVHSVTAARRELTGLWLFDGFLLGGETILRAYEDDEPSLLRQDLDLEAPFLRLTYGTKTYMCGTLEPKDLRAEYLPPLVWRYNAGNAYVFVVNGAYISDVAGMGILETLMYDKQDYSLQPVINAQTLSIIGFPTFASENEEVMRALYGRTQYGFETEVLLPDMVAAGQRNNFALTCFASPQLNYGDEDLPDYEIYAFFMRQLRAEKAEVALNMGQSVSALTTEERWDSIQDFFHSIGTRYDFRAVRAAAGEVPFLAAQDSVRTIICDPDGALPVVGYLNNDTTVLTSLSNVLSISFMDEFRLKCIESLLGYSNAVLDLTSLYWPDEDDHEWMQFREIYTSNLHTYWLPYTKYDRVTVSQADGRYRVFAATEVASARQNNTIAVRTSMKDCYLLLRTHGEMIRRISGADATQLEEDAFLIHMKDTRASIELEKTILYR